MLESQRAHAVVVMHFRRALLGRKKASEEHGEDSFPVGLFTKAGGGSED